MMPPGPWLYPEDQISEAPVRALAAEITREKIFERLHDELPYQSTVETQSWEERAGRFGAGRADDLCHARGAPENRARRRRPDDQGDRDGGAQGYAEAAEQPIHLFLFVKVREHWDRRPGTLPRDGTGISAKDKKSRLLGRLFTCGRKAREGRRGWSA